MITDPELEELYGIKFEEPKFSKTAINAVRTACKIKNDYIINIKNAFSNGERRIYLNEGSNMIRGIKFFTLENLKKESYLIQWEFNKQIRALEEEFYKY